MYIGSLDELRIYNRALDPSEIVMLAQCCKGRAMLALVRNVLVAALCGIALLPPRAADAGPAATLAAIAPSASDVRKAVAIGPTGQVYEPDGKGAWVRRRPGGTTEDIVGATAIAGGTAIAIARNAPPFKLKAGAWSAIVLTPKAKPVVGAGSRVLVANGKNVYALDRATGEPTKLPDAPAPVITLAASKSRAVIATDKGLYELQGPGAGTSWKAIKKAPRTVRSFVSERWAIVDRGVLDLKSLKTIAWPAGVRFDEATTIGETLIVVVGKGKQRDLLTLSGKAAPAKPKAKAGKGKAKGTNGKGAADDAATEPGTATTGAFERETIPIDAGAAVVGVIADDDKRVAVATRDGTIAVRAGGSWTTVEVRDELPAAKPGPAPALSLGVGASAPAAASPSSATAAAPGNAGAATATR